MMRLIDRFVKCHKQGLIINIANPFCAYRKTSVIRPGLIQLRKGFWVGLKAEGLISGRANKRNKYRLLHRKCAVRIYIHELQNFGKRTSERSERVSFPKFCNE